MNEFDASDLHLVAGVPPDAFGDPPGYEQRDVSDDIEPNMLFPLASGAEHVHSAQKPVAIVVTKAAERKVFIVLLRNRSSWRRWRCRVTARVA